MKSELYLVDSSAWIEFLRPKGSMRIREHVTSLVLNDQALITAIIKAEVLQGAKSEKEYEDLERRLRAVRYCAFDETLWTGVFRTGFQMRRKGFSTPVTDVMIAVLAQSQDAIVVHADKHFDELSSVTGLKVTSYVASVGKR